MQANWMSKTFTGNLIIIFCTICKKVQQTLRDPSTNIVCLTYPRQVQSTSSFKFSGIKYTRN